MEREQDTTGISRAQNHLHVLPEDWQSVATIAEPYLDRIDVDAPAPQLLIVTSDAEAAAAIARRIARTSRRDLRILAATNAQRATRVLRSGSVHAIVCAAITIAELLRSAVLKLAAVRTVVLAWVDDLDAAGMSALETLMGEVPKDSTRIVLAAELSPFVEQLAERYARRARRVQPSATESLAAVSLSYVTTGAAARLDAVRRILDALDPASAFIVVRDAELRARVDELLRALGYGDESDLVRAGERPDADVQVIILFDIPTSQEQLRRLVAEHTSARVIALVAPRHVRALRRMAGGSVAPLQLPEAAARARSREQALRDELRALITSGQSSRELLALEPLLSEFDGAEVAAAALRLLDAERAKAHAIPATSTPSLTRLFVNVGAMDNVRPGDLVGAITNEVGLSKADVGKVDVRERHSTVEVATHVANAVVAKLTGTSIRGRRVLAKVDEERERRDRGPRRDDVRLGSRDRGRRPPSRGRPRPDA